MTHHTLHISSSETDLDYTSSNRLIPIIHYNPLYTSPYQFSDYVRSVCQTLIKSNTFNLTKKDLSQKILSYPCSNCPTITLFYLIENQGSLFIVCARSTLTTNLEFSIKNEESQETHSYVFHKNLYSIASLYRRSTVHFKCVPKRIDNNDDNILGSVISINYHSEIREINNINTFINLKLNLIPLTDIRRVVILILKHGNVNYTVIRDQIHLLKALPPFYSEIICNFVYIYSFIRYSKEPDNLATVKINSLTNNKTLHFKNENFKALNLSVIKAIKFPLSIEFLKQFIGIENQLSQSFKQIESLPFLITYSCCLHNITSQIYYSAEKLNESLHSKCKKENNYKKYKNNNYKNHFLRIVLEEIIEDENKLPINKNFICEIVKLVKIFGFIPIYDLSKITIEQRSNPLINFFTDCIFDTMENYSYTNIFSFLNTEITLLNETNDPDETNEWLFAIIDKTCVYLVSKFCSLNKEEIEIENAYLDKLNNVETIGANLIEVFSKAFSNKHSLLQGKKKVGQVMLLDDIKIPSGKKDEVLQLLNVGCVKNGELELSLESFLVKLSSLNHAHIASKRQLLDIFKIVNAIGIPFKEDATFDIPTFCKLANNINNINTDYFDFMHKQILVIIGCSLSIINSETSLYSSSTLVKMSKINNFNNKYNVRDTGVNMLINSDYLCRYFNFSLTISNARKLITNIHTRFVTFNLLKPSLNEMNLENEFSRIVVQKSIPRWWIKGKHDVCLLECFMDFENLEWDERIVAKLKNRLNLNDIDEQELKVDIIIKRYKKLVVAAVKELGLGNILPIISI